MTAIEVIVELVRAQPEIKCLSLDVYTPSLNTKELPQKPNFVRLLTHCPSTDHDAWGRNNFTAESVKQTLPRLGVNEVISVRSDIVRILGNSHGCYHIPMMDFIEPATVEEIRSFLSVIGHSNGAILSSGRSFHYYGLGLLNKKEWYDFLADCLLSGIADARYIGHRLKDRCCVLRVSACPLRPKVPTVVSIL